MDRDISKQTINVLFVLAILVMLLGTVTIYLEASNLELQYDVSGDGQSYSPGAGAQASLRVLGEPEVASQSGEVTLTIVE